MDSLAMCQPGSLWGGWLFGNIVLAMKGGFESLSNTGDSCYTVFEEGHYNQSK